VKNSYYKIKNHCWNVLSLTTYRRNKLMKKWKCINKAKRWTQINWNSMCKIRIRQMLCIIRCQLKANKPYKWKKLIFQIHQVLPINKINQRSNLKKKPSKLNQSNGSSRNKIHYTCQIMAKRRRRIKMLNLQKIRIDNTQLAWNINQGARKWKGEFQLIFNH